MLEMLSIFSVGVVLGIGLGICFCCLISEKAYEDEHNPYFD